MKIFTLIVKHYFISAAACVVLVGGGYLVFHSNGSSFRTVPVVRGMISEEVQVTGKTKSAEDLKLAFERGGRVIAVDAEVGIRVRSGQSLVRLDHRELDNQLREAEANVSAERAKLEQLQKGTRPEELSIAEAKVTNALKSKEEAKKTLVERLQDSYTKSEDAVRGKIDQLFSNPRGSNPTLNFLSFDHKAEVERGRFLIEILLVDWQKQLLGLTVTSNVSSLASMTSQNLERVRVFLDTVAIGVNALTTSSTLSESTLEGYRADVSTARANVSTAIVNFAAAEEKLSDAEADALVADRELTLKRAGALPEEITIQESLLHQAEARAAGFRVQIDKTVLRSPIAGVVTLQDAKIGQIVSANTIITSVISENTLQVEANVPELEVGKVKTGEEVQVTFDAFPREMFRGVVQSIDPAEVLVDGVVNFRVVVRLTTIDMRLKSGLTTNLSIITTKRDAVLTLPKVVVSGEGSSTVVQIMTNGKPTEVPVTLGIEGSDGRIEILSGLTEGQEVIDPTSK